MSVNLILEGVGGRIKFRVLGLFVFHVLTSLWSSTTSACQGAVTIIRVIFAVSQPSNSCKGVNLFFLSFFFLFCLLFFNFFFSEHLSYMNASVIDVIQLLEFYTTRMTETTSEDKFKITKAIASGS